MSSDYGVQIIEVSDSIKEKPMATVSASSDTQAEIGPMATAQRTEAQTIDPEMVKVEELVTVIADVMTNLVEHMVNTGKNIAAILVAKINSLTNR